MNLSEIKSFLGQDWSAVDEQMRNSLRSDIQLLDATNQTILTNSGKQLRPMLLLLIARICSDGKPTVDSIRYAAAIELLHNATLLHDDVADCSSERRGVPTVASILGGPASVLLGDFWLVKAMENVLSSARHGNEAIRIFSKTLSDLAEGELLQLQKAETADTTEEDYLRIIYSKTASIFETLAVTAAISVDASEEKREAVKEYSVALGTAFQIKDDIFDYSGGSEIGKPVGIDLEEGKITLPLLGALKSVGEEKEKEIRSMVSDIQAHPENKEAIRTFVLENGGLEYAGKRLGDYVSTALAALDIFPESEEKKALTELAKYMINRKV